MNNNNQSVSTFGISRGGKKGSDDSLFLVSRTNHSSHKTLTSRPPPPSLIFFLPLGKLVSAGSLPMLIANWVSFSLWL